VDRTRYTIVVAGEVADDWRPALAPLEVSVGDGRTMLSSPPLDQVGLQSVLARLAELGLNLVSVTGDAEVLPA
jgi:hypothetical protein